MPLLAQQPDTLPAELLDEAYLSQFTDRHWWVLQTRPRTEKKLMTRLQKEGIDFHCPLIEKQYRSPNGRFRKSFIPVFTSYVFLFGDWDARHFAYRTDYVARDQEVKRTGEFLRDIRQIRDAIRTGVPLTLESRLQKGQRVTVKSGPFQGFEGTVLRRAGKTRLVLSVAYLDQGVSMEIEACQLQPI